MVRGPFVNHLRKIKEFVRETKRNPNDDISHLGTEMATFKKFESFQIHFENSRKLGKSHLQKN